MELSLNRLYFDGITNNLKDQDEKEKKNQRYQLQEKVYILYEMFLS